VAFGVGVVATSGLRGAAQFNAWASLAVALSAASGAVLGYGLACWPTVAGAVRVRDVLPTLAALAAIGAVLLVAGNVSQPANGVDVTGSLLTLFNAVGGLPVAACIAAARLRSRQLPEPLGERAEAILTLRRQLSGFLTALGALVALATLAVGAAVRVAEPRRDNMVVVIFGASMSLMVALVYAPTAAAVRERARELAATTVPLAGADASELAERVESRKRLEQALGVDRGLLADLQTDVVILAPLVASGLATFLPG
jgi:hypothetical protein